MQHNWKNTVQQQEVMPPESVWDTLVLALEKENKNPHWETRIYHAAETPPTNTWQQIVTTLDQSQHTNDIAWQERLRHYQAVPPINSWQAIAEVLDENAKYNWPALMYQHEALPPQEVWEAIAAQMDAGETPVIPITTQSSTKRIFRLVAAAVTIAAISVTVIWLSNDGITHNSAGNMAANNVAKFVPPASTPVTNERPATNPPTTARFTAALTPTMAIKVANVVKTATTQASPTAIPPLEYVTNNETAYVVAEPVLHNTNKLLNDNGQAVMDVNSLSAPNSEYISISGPDGQTIRVSSKFANLLGYLKEGPDVEERLDQIIKESAYWKATFKQWREKMTQLDLTPSLNNFMDVVELAKILQQ